MNKTALLLLPFWAQKAFAQTQPDSLFAQVQDNRLMLVHTVRKGEELVRIAEQYHLSPEVVATENGIAYPPALFEGAKVRIPLDSTNLSESFGAGDRPVYFHCQGHENFVVLAQGIGQTFRNLQALNPGLKQYCTPGNRVLIGYFRKMEPSVVPDEVIPEKDRVLPPDTSRLTPIRQVPENPVPEPVLSSAEASFKEAIDAGMPLVVQTGPVTFFPGGNGATYYAFHSAAPHGTILRLRNPANGRVIFAKVIGQVPGTKNFYKSLAGVSENARQALGSLGDFRLWCEVSYAAY